MTARIRDIAYVRHGHPDLALAEAFLQDFGLSRVSRTSRRLVMRAANGYPAAYLADAAATSQLRSIGVVLADAQAIEAAASWPEAIARERVGDPVPGYALSVRDPDGHVYDLLAGSQWADRSDTDRPEEFNSGRHTPRVNATRVAPPQLATVMRLGHVALKVTDLARSLDWYQRRLGMLVSDLVYEDRADQIVTAFLRCDRGSEPADHHTIALVQSATAGLHHTSFEVKDLDALAAGGEWLARRGHRRVWGVGRHLLGSQIFDYWADPFGNKIEHYADGDVFDRSHPAQLHAQGPETLYQWGPPVPADFGD